RYIDDQDDNRQQRIYVPELLGLLRVQIRLLEEKLVPQGMQLGASRLPQRPALVGDRGIMSCRLAALDAQLDRSRGLVLFGAGEPGDLGDVCAVQRIGG